MADPKPTKPAAKTTTEKVTDAAKDAAGKVREGAEKARESFAEHVIDPARRAGEAMRESGKKAAEGGATISAKLIDQAESNAKEAFAAMREAAKAKDISEVMRIQGDYLREQGQRSMTQAREISELILQFGRDVVTPLRPDTTTKK